MIFLTHSRYPDGTQVEGKRKVRRWGGRGKEGKEWGNLGQASFKFADRERENGTDEVSPSFLYFTSPISSVSSCYFLA